MPIWGFECEECDRMSDKRIVADQPPSDEVPTCKCGRRMQPVEIVDRTAARHYYQRPPTAWHPKDRLIWETGLRRKNAH